jgi:hypothetical protein
MIMMKFPKDHPYMIRLDKALQESKFATLFATHGEYCEDMKEEILNSLFHPPSSEDIRK